MEIRHADFLKHNNLSRLAAIKQLDLARKARATQAKVFRLVPESRDWQPVLDRLGLSAEQIWRIASKARFAGVSFERKLIASGLVAEADFYQAIAAELGIAFLPSIEADCLVDRFSLDTPVLRATDKKLVVRCHDAAQEVVTVVAPDRQGMLELRRQFHLAPNLRTRIRITTPSAIRQAVSAWLQNDLDRHATKGLFDRFPASSARFVLYGWQGLVVGLLIPLAPLALFLQPTIGFRVLHVITLVFFLGCIALRVGAIRHAHPPRPKRLRPVDRAGLPTYSVLVAVYREAHMIPELVAALDRLKWPRSKLDIKLVCEADDLETIAAARALDLPPHFDIVAVPPSLPRTKPKALSYALPQARGDYIVLYDAEDHPHPCQLIEAWQAFEDDADGRLACVQAPLEISNKNSAGMVATMFGFEYAALFRGFLPWLAQNKLILPLGGTSNHFRREVLEEVGGWDPYNVTEDADLGIRLARCGYRTATITKPTLELAPTRFKVWLPQRSRWLKGWCQSWLVHMRHPLQLYRELGPASFCAAQLLLAGMVVSALAHPVLVAHVFYGGIQMALGVEAGPERPILLLLDIVSIVGGYMSFLLLGWSTLRPRERQQFWRIVVYTPAYWFMLCIAAMKAIWQLFFRPHHWEKTPHVLVGK